MDEMESNEQAKTKSEPEPNEEAQTKNTTKPEPPAKTKDQLERDKLSLEIAELQREWWKRPAYIAAFFPSVLALLTLAYGLGNGYFDAEFARLENKKYELERETRLLEERKTRLLERVQEAQALLDAKSPNAADNNANTLDTKMMLKDLEDQIRKVNNPKDAETIRQRLQAFLDYLLQVNSNTNK